MRKKKKSFKRKKITNAELQNRILQLFKKNPNKKFSPKQIGAHLNVGNNKDSVKAALDQLREKGLLRHRATPKFKLKPKGLLNLKQTLEGEIDMTRTGSAYVVTDDHEEDVYIPAKRMNGALHGDKVRVKAYYPKNRSKPEGEVIDVLERANDHFLGTLNITRNYALVIPDNPNMAFDIYLEKKHLKEAQDGDKVVVKIIEWPSRSKPTPMGKITSVLGKVGSSDIEMKSILINNGFHLDFPDEVMKEAKKLQPHITAQEESVRRDMRDITTFTIDPLDAKDFDDALSIQLLENGELQIGVHIADVTHFVKSKTALDKEAYKRSTSVYLVDRVLPMLPEKISNELCSLRPNEDKYTFSAIFNFDEKNKITKEWFGKTLIHSDKRFTYEEAQEVMENGRGMFYNELFNLNTLAKKLRKARFKKGAINFETEEVKFKLDETGKPIGLYIKERKDAHLLVEEYMLLANRRVAEHIQKIGKKQEIPFVYRIHDLPNEDKVNDFAAFAKELGVTMDTKNEKTIAKSYNEMMAKVAQDPGLKVLESLAIRTMSKAAYSPDNIGHYGLAMENYSHFTSPIRRYSDVLAHRILEKNLEGNTFRVNKSKLSEKCMHISKMERKAMKAERESIKYKQVEYMQNRVGNDFDGYITGFSDRGFFVELADVKSEGMVKFNTTDDHYIVDASRLKARGNKFGKIYKMGDKVRVRVKSADLERKQIDLVFTDAEAE